MGARVFKRWEQYVHRICPVLLFVVRQHFAHVIGVADSDVAFSGPDGFYLCAVVALRFAGEVGLDAFQPVFCTVFAVVVHHGRGQGDVIGVGARAGADATLPLVGCQIFVGGDFSLCNTVLRGIDDACAGSQAVPVAIRIAIGLWNVIKQSGARGRLGQTFVHDGRKTRDIDCEYKVSR